MSNAEYIRDLMLTCPHITVSTLDMHIDQVGAEPLSYSIESLPSDPVLKRYLGGDSLRAYPFQLTARRVFFSDEDRIANVNTFERVTDWMEQQTRLRLLPAMDDGQEPKQLQATGCTYVMEQAADSNSAVYIMQAQLVYYQKARN